MGIWNYYFIAKLFLYFGHYIDFHVWPNLALAALLIAPIPPRLARLKTLRQIVAVPCGLALFYYDTWLPPITRVFSQASQLEGFSLTYLWELLGRFFNPWVVVALVLLYAVYYFARKKLRITSFVLLAMLLPLLPYFSQRPGAAPNVVVENADPRGNARQETTAPQAPPATDTELNVALNSFYQEEAGRSVSYSAPAAGDAPFDVIFLQICSLSWDDLAFTKERDNPLFKRFDIMFTDFSSGASYSGPAAIRLLRGSCGQTAHGALYNPAAPQCKTFDDLSQIGFEPEFAMNHDGHYGGFIDDVRERGGLKAQLFDAGTLPPYLQSFDGSPVHDDYTVLSKWWNARLHLKAARVALFYNSISLHDGNRYSGKPNAPSLEIYKPRLTQLLADIDHFFSDLQKSGRRVVVVFIPEHGAAIRGDKMQIAGLREIPSPRISNVPVGIKLIGIPEKPNAQPLVISKPVSYLAVSQLLSEFVSITPFGKNSLSLEEYVRDLPTTEFVAENEDVMVIRHGARYYIRAKNAGWVEYDPSQ